MASREIVPWLVRASAQFSILLVTGARQVGKTTSLLELAEREGRGRTYVTLDDPTLRTLAREDPALFLRRFPPPLVLDEVQYAPELFPHLKILVDARRSEPGLVWMSGSQPYPLMRGVRESLAGRVAVTTLRGLSQRESAGLPFPSGPFIPTRGALDERTASHASVDATAVYERVFHGAYPAHVVGPQRDRDLFFSSLVDTWLSRDVRELVSVHDQGSFLRFVKACAARTGQLVGYADLARDADVSPNTAKAWLSVLETSSVIRLLAPYHSNANKRLVKTPKLYFLDTGLASYLGGWSSATTLMDGAMAGPMLETFVVGEIEKSFLHRGMDAPIFFYRDRDGVEIDLLVVRDGIGHPIEVKRSSSPKREWISGFAAVETTGLRRGGGVALCLSECVVPLTDQDDAVPIGMI